MTLGFVVRDLLPLLGGALLCVHGRIWPAFLHCLDGLKPRPFVGVAGCFVSQLLWLRGSESWFGNKDIGKQKNFLSFKCSQALLEIPKSLLWRLQAQTLFKIVVSSVHQMILCVCNCSARLKKMPQVKGMDIDIENGYTPENADDNGKTTIWSLKMYLLLKMVVLPLQCYFTGG